MRALRTQSEVDEMVELARAYYSMLIASRLAKAEGRLSAEQESASQRELMELDAKLERQKNTCSPHRSDATEKRFFSHASKPQGQNNDRRLHSA